MASPFEQSFGKDDTSPLNGNNPMFSFIKRLLQQLVRKSTYVNHDSINKVSIVILILIDIFVLFNVFSGLDNISQWPLSPSEEVPCFRFYESYQTSKQKGTLDYDTQTIEALIYENRPSLSLDQRAGRLGSVSSLCNDEIRLRNGINIPSNVTLKSKINQSRIKVSNLTQEINTLQRQYDSTLLEKIANQAPQKSINRVPADQVKAKIEANKAEILKIKKIIIEQQQRLIQQSASATYLKVLKDGNRYENLKTTYHSAEFWYPNKQLLLQTLFLLPLIAIAYFTHTFAIRRNKDIIALISWHLLVIFCIPLLVKFFEFIQFGNLVGFILEGLTALLGGLLFITSYLLILLIPLLGFLLIKGLQRFVFNSKVQARKRIQNTRCINCNFKLRGGDEFCPSCGFGQLIDCPNCHQQTYKFTSFCKQCGHHLEGT